MKPLYRILKEFTSGKYWWMDPWGKIYTPQDAEAQHEDMTTRIYGKFIDSVDFYKEIYPKGWVRCNFYKGSMGVEMNTKQLNRYHLSSLKSMWKRLGVKKLHVDARDGSGPPRYHGGFETLQAFWEKYK